MFCNEITSDMSYLEIAHLTRQMPVHVLGCSLPFQTTGYKIQSSYHPLLKFNSLLELLTELWESLYLLSLFIIKNVTQEQPKERAAWEKKLMNFHALLGKQRLVLMLSAPQRPCVKGLPPGVVLLGGKDSLGSHERFSVIVGRTPGKDDLSASFPFSFVF